MTTSRMRRLLGSAAVAVIAAAVTLMGAPAASAAPIVPGTPATGNLFVHKHQTPASATNGNGLPLTQPPATPTVDGVTFTVRQLNPTTYNLTTNAGWLALDALTLAQAPSVATGTPISIVTGAAGTPGQALFANLPIGAYYVEETAYPANVSPAAPFVVTIPITHPTDLNTWLYDVHVYPKNSITATQKTVTDAAAIQLGNEVTFTVTGDIPDPPTGQTIDGYRVRDVLAANLSPVAAGTTAALSSGSPALTPGTHYTVTITGQTVLVTFTPAGLTLLQANSTQSVVTTIRATVIAVGEIANTAAVFPNNVSWNGGAGTGVLTNTVNTNWGALQVQKTSAASGASLAGAEFKVYPSQADAVANTNAISLPSTNPNTADPSVWITGANGLLTITGLRYSNFVNGVGVADGAPGQRQYWLVETKAPVGYELKAQPIPVSVNAQLVVQTVQNAEKGAGFQLPFTGGSGLWLFPIGGALLLIGSAILMTVKRRRIRRLV